MPMPTWLRDELQGYLFGECSPMEESMSSAKLKVVIGGFYEHLAARMIGGEHGKVPPGWEVYPDVVLRGTGKERDLLVEVKGASRKYGIIVDHGQCKKYMDMRSWVMPFYHPVVHYMFFIHNVKRPEATCKTVGEMVEALCDSTLCALLLPLDLIHVMTQLMPVLWYVGDGYGSRGDEEHPTYMRLSGPKIEKWCHSPMECRESIERLMVEKDERFKLKEWDSRSSVVKGQTVAGIEVKPFLLTTFVEKKAKK